MNLQTEFPRLRRRAVRAAAAAAFPFISSALVATAELRSGDDSRFGADRITIDDTTGIEWLDLEVTFGLTFSFR